MDRALRGRRQNLLELYDEEGTLVPARFDGYMAGEGVDIAILFAEYSPKSTGIQAVEDLLPIIDHNPDRFRLMANLNPHLHYPLVKELKRQISLGAVGLKLHPVHGCFTPNDRMLYPAYAFCESEDFPVVFHCGTSVFPGSPTATPIPPSSRTWSATSPISPSFSPTAGVAGGTTPQPSSP